MIWQLLGKLLGWGVNGWAWIWKTNGRTVKLLLWIGIGIIAVPPVTQYWLSRVKIPDIPITAIIGMAIASLFLTVFSVSIYLLANLLQRVWGMERVAVHSMPAPMMARQPYSDGAFIPTNDAALRDAEELAIMKAKGILKETDVADLASELGHAEILKRRGRTE